MKKLLFMTLTLLLVVAGVNAQKIDQRLTRLVEQVNARRAQGLRPVNAEAVNKTMVVDFNADGSIKALSAIATLKDGAEWPTAQLEQMGIKVRYIVGNQAALVIPADKLLQLEQGTSMATPHAAGIVTLWMQAKPTLTVNEIKEIMKETCLNDEFTTTVAKIPSGNKVQAGLGKIDCLAGLKKILNTTGIEAIEAGGHREATPATMYGVDAPVYNMMGQRVDKSQKGLVIYKGRKYVNK